MEPERLGELLDRHAAALELFARQWCDTPEDVVQDAFLKLAALPTPPDEPAAWLFRVVRNGAMDASRAARRRRKHEALATRSAAWFEGPDSDRPVGTIDPEDAADALRALPDEEREVIVAHLWGGLSFDQVAGLISGSSSTAHRLYSRGLSALRERLGVTCRKTRRNPS
ncbi:RNA polymerase sigma factor SigL [Aquisphaera giovannonii]|uniref:RNA polymerase sigma factor SigL n=1 Tax=Aquisphaera giovannonii TaxID=406548 RepID=A0A5B9W0R7_9BACT|nr:sigma-70 family RNA polymerase sigma factor [Aquisphaera giovannonii]QEH33887.1 RNA polymerase sigma factor SigL [Aquisphaera giovannonii]